MQIGDLVTLYALEHTNTDTTGLIVDIAHRPGGWCKVLWTEMGKTSDERIGAIKVISENR